ncbi:MAG: DUF805 domain-containing protein [Candidatus Shapirobacteria bacterium]|nr:DUF805 domain-containing protein [Candidatus Shapirobacteria bacterium]
MKNRFNLFKGRIGVCNFWIGMTSPLIICYLISFIPTRILILSLFVNIIYFVIGIIYSIYFFSLIIRRLHDHNKSGWFGLASYIPIYGLYVLFLMFYLPGNSEVNKYGLPNNKISIKNILGITEE